MKKPHTYDIRGWKRYRERSDRERIFELSIKVRELEQKIINLQNQLKNLENGKTDSLPVEDAVQ